MGGKRRNRFWSLKGTHKETGIRYESGFEKKFLDQCYLRGIKVVRCPSRVPYRDADGHPHHFEPDFLLPDFDFVVEIKGIWALRDNHGNVKEKYHAAMAYFNGRFAMMTERELKSDYLSQLHVMLVNGN